MTKNSKRTNRTMLLVTVLIVGLTALTLFWFDYNSVDKMIERHYSRVHMPDSLTLENKLWRQPTDAMDDTLFPAWDYTYHIRSGVSNGQARQEVERVFRQAGYKITNMSDDEFLVADNKIYAQVKIDLRNTLGEYKPKDPQHTISVWVQNN